jgi:hypothetical protein
VIRIVLSEEFCGSKGCLINPSLTLFRHDFERKPRTVLELNLLPTLCCLLGMIHTSFEVVV